MTRLINLTSIIQILIVMRLQMETIMADQKAKLSIKNSSVELDILSGTLGPEVVDVSTLFKTGYFTYDPGFLSTASCESKITYIDGDKGILLYRGYPIDQLAVDSSFVEVCYLLLHGELPNTVEFNEFCHTI